MSEPVFLEATLDKRRDSISQKDDQGMIRLGFPLIPNPEGSRPTGEWVKLINSEWEKGKQGSGGIEIAQIKLTIDYDNVFFELPPFALDRLEAAIDRLEGILEIQNKIYAANVRKQKSAEANKDQKLNEILDRISKK